MTSCRHRNYMVKAVIEVVKFSGSACSIISCLTVEILVLKNSTVSKRCHLVPGLLLIMPHHVEGRVLGLLLIMPHRVEGRVESVQDPRLFPGRLVFADLPSSSCQPMWMWILNLYSAVSWNISIALSTLVFREKYSLQTTPKAAAAERWITETVR